MTRHDIVLPEDAAAPGAAVAVDHPVRAGQHPGDTPGADRPSLLRLRLDVGYDGAGFSGWAVQPGRRTVAGVLSDALTRLLQKPEGLTVAGRTDTGVHARGQVCHVDVPPDAWAAVASSVLRRLAGVLPPDVRVYAVREVPPTFDARFSALRRWYAYRVTDAPYGAEPLRRHDTLAWPRPLDVVVMDEAAAGLCGEHDFAAYCRRRDNATTIRAVQRLTWERDADGVAVATVVADAFCHSMVRSLVGAMLAVGDGRRPVEWPASLLSRRERANDVVVAPPYGLTLTQVDYPDSAADYASRAALTRNIRVAAPGA